MTDGIELTETRETLWITDAELIRRIGVPEKIVRQNLHEFDTKPQLGFPQKSKIWGGRRYWPAVKAYFDKLHRLNPQEERRRA